MVQPQALLPAFVTYATRAPSTELNNSWQLTFVLCIPSSWCRYTVSFVKYGVKVYNTVAVSLITKLVFRLLQQLIHAQLVARQEKGPVANKTDPGL